MSGFRLERRIEIDQVNALGREPAPGSPRSFGRPRRRRVRLDRAHSARQKLLSQRQRPLRLKRHRHHFAVGAVERQHDRLARAFPGHHGTRFNLGMFAARRYRPWLGGRRPRIIFIPCGNLAPASRWGLSSAESACVTGLKG